MAFFAPMSEEHGRISAVTATRILQRMVNGDVGDVDEDAFASAHGTAQLRPKKRRGRTRMKAKKQRGKSKKAVDIGFMEKIIIRNELLERQTTRIKEDFNALTQDVKLLVEEKDELRSIVEKYRAQNAELKAESKKITELVVGLKVAEKTISQEKREKVKLEGELRKVSEERDALQVKLKEAREASRIEIERRDEAARILKQNNAELQSNISAIEAQLKAKNEEITTIKEDFKVEITATLKEALAEQARRYEGSPQSKSSSKNGQVETEEGDRLEKTITVDEYELVENEHDSQKRTGMLQEEKEDLPPITMENLSTFGKDSINVGSDSNRSALGEIESKLDLSRKRTQKLEKDLIDVMQRQTMTSIAASILSQSGLVKEPYSKTFRHSPSKPPRIPPQARRDDVHTIDRINYAKNTADQTELESTLIPPSILDEINKMSKNELIGAIAKYQVMIDSLSHQRSTRRRHTEKFATHASNHYLPVKKNNTTNNNITNKIRDMKSTHWHSRPRINSESNKSVSSSLNVSTISNDNIDLALQMVTHQTRNETALRQQNRILREKWKKFITGIKT